MNVRELIKDAGYRFVKAENGRAVLASREAASVDLLEYLRDVYRYHFNVPTRYIRISDLK